MKTKIIENKLQTAIFLIVFTSVIKLSLFSLGNVLTYLFFENMITSISTLSWIQLSSIFFSYLIMGILVAKNTYPLNYQLPNASVLLLVLCSVFDFLGAVYFEIINHSYSLFVLSGIIGSILGYRFILNRSIINDQT